MDFGKIFSRALKYPFNVQVFLVMLVVNLVFSYSGLYFIGLTDPVAVSTLLNLGPAIIPLVIAGIIASILVTIFLMGLYVDNASKYFSSGRKSLLSNLPTAKKKFFRLLGTYILMVMIVIISALPMVALAGIKAFSAGAGAYMPVSIGAVIGLAIMLIVLFFVSLATYIAVLDKFGILGSIKVSANVVNKNKLSMFIFWILYLIIATALGLLSVAVLLVSVLALDIRILILQSFITTYTTLFAYSAFTNFYLSVKKK